uniref:NAD-dependent epimerase/dehydratase family protein n=1 Tax=Clostridium sp. 12(A) TaxID=1163671 RepID=UPI00046349C2|nr:NAD(P)-dependent oxidoreductase [Clostridium sp. 12(A)]
MNILVTGGTGFIGEHFIPQLLEQGHKIRLLVRNLNKAKELFKDTCEYFIGDVTDRDSLNGCCDGIDIVYHMVAKVGNQLPSEESFSIFRAVNVEGTRNIADESKKKGVSRFIFVSSIAAMGIVKTTPITEESQCSPYLPYQVTKYEAERLLNDYYKGGFPCIIVRPTKVYGVGEHEYSYLTLAKLCKKGIFPKIGSGNNYTSNIYVTDFVQALIKLVDNGVIGETYILTSDGSIDFTEMGKTIAQTIGKKIIIIPVPVNIMIYAAAAEEAVFNAIRKKPVVTKKNIEATITNRVYDISKAKAQLDFLPKVSMQQGIIKTIQWYKKTNLV